MSMILRAETAFALDPVGKATRRQTNQKHLVFIRTLPSVVSGAYGCDACHIRMREPRHGKHRPGMGRKPSDCWTLPMTRAEHEHQHSMSERAFWLMHGMDDPCGFALALHEITGQTEEAERLIRAHLRSIVR